MKDLYKTKVLLSMPRCLIPIGTTLRLTHIDLQIGLTDKMNCWFKVIADTVTSEGEPVLDSISGTELVLNGKYLKNYLALDGKYLNNCLE